MGIFPLPPGAGLAGRAQGLWGAAGARGGERGRGGGGIGKQGRRAPATPGAPPPLLSPPGGLFIWYGVVMAIHWHPLAGQGLATRGSSDVT